MKKSESKSLFTARAQAEIYITFYLYELEKVNKLVMGTVLGNQILLTSLGDPVRITGPDGIFEGVLTYVNISEEQDDQMSDRLLWGKKKGYSQINETLPILTLRAKGVWKGTEKSLGRQSYRGLHWFKSDVGEPFRLDNIGPVEGAYGVAQTLELYQERKDRYHRKFWYEQSAPKLQPWTRWSYKLTPLGVAKMEQWLRSITDIDHSSYIAPSYGKYKNMRCRNALEYVLLTVYMDYNRIDPKHSALEDWATLCHKNLYCPLPTPREETFDHFRQWLESNFLEFDDQLQRHEERYRAQPTERNLRRLERYREELGISGIMPHALS